MKKFTLIILALLLLNSCSNDPALFNLNAKNFGKNATISIISTNGELLKVENIKENNQTFQVNLPKEGFAALKVENGIDVRDFWFHLTSGTYNLVLNAEDNRTIYPFKKTPSTQGEDFIHFYSIKNKLNKPITDSLLLAKRAVDAADLTNINVRVDVLADLMDRTKTLDLNAIETFAKKHPNSENTIFLLDQLVVTDLNSEKFEKIFSYLSDDVKNSKAGKKLLEQITRVNNSKPGNLFAGIAGETPDGKAFSKEIFKKVNLVFVWTSYNNRCRTNNKALLTLYNKYKNQGVEFIGVSLDSKRNWWVNVIRDDKLSWPQFSDLKGAKSPNAKNIGNYNVPYFMILDKNGKILMSEDISLEMLEADIIKYLRKVS
ncbi:TlpA disulfide reductase family protein [Pedobacter sp. Leaf132]|uniref:TlpA family protein disulfide reductase n=1 Tax=Pedobacter sp. Leaf132 TaxID=2876557 RepID=UPI001E47FD9C|nr:TlpA disulfide reductase family protein [Pedobacter sp. Leaf132]